MYEDALPELIRRRCRVLRCPLPEGAFPWDRLRGLTRKSPSAWTLLLVRTWANGWTTSRRMHEHHLECCPACAAADSDELGHFLECH
eukprot:7225307-Alexandrium_andersonii.AAC.1